MSTKRMLIYVAGPLTGSGLVWSNVRNAMQVADEIVKCGHFPFIPHLSFLHAMSTEIAAALPEAYWLRWGLVMVERCDALYRVPGKSSGSDAEVAHAKLLGRPVYHNLTEIPEVDTNELPWGEAWWAEHLEALANA